MGASKNLFVGVHTYVVCSSRHGRVLVLCLFSKGVVIVTWASEMRRTPICLGSSSYFFLSVSGRHNLCITRTLFASLTLLHLVKYLDLLMSCFLLLDLTSFLLDAGQRIYIIDIDNIVILVDMRNGKKLFRPVFQRWQHFQLLIWHTLWCHE